MEDIMNFFRISLVSLICATALTSAAMADTYTIDPAHSSVGFSIKHLMVSDVTGTFTTFNGMITLDAKNPTANAVSATIQTKSINTGNEQRDTHLRSADFFDAETNPTITFKSTSVKGSGPIYTVTGDLTIKGVTKSITFPMTIAGPITSPMGGDQVIGLSGQTKINRQDYDVKWNKQMDQGGFVLGNDVIININLEAHAK